MRPHRRILPVRIKSALTRRRILLPFHHDGALLLPDNESKLPARPNGAVHVMSTVMQQFLLSATEAEVGATFYGCQDAVPLRNTLTDLGHFQGATLIIKDNE